MRTTRKRRALVAALGLCALLAAIAFMNAGDDPLFSLLERYPAARDLIRGACELVGLGDAFDRRFGRWRFM